MAIADYAELRTVYKEPGPRAAQKVLDYLDEHLAKFIALSPLCVIATANAKGQTDASPRGGPPGFVKLVNERMLMLPDMPGNDQVDSFQNLVENPGIGLLFFVPGMNETLRVNGFGEIVTDASVLDPAKVKRRTPVSGLQITVEEAFLHCGRSLIRSRIWDPSVRIERSAYPTYGEVLADQINGADAKEIDKSEDEANRQRLY